MKIFAFILLYATPFLVSSQTAGRLEQQRENDIYVTRLMAFIPWGEKYRYPEFRSGNVFYTTHKESSSLQLNYNLYLREIEVINEKDDTVYLANFEIVKYILLDRDLYVHDVNKGYFEILSNPNDSIRLIGQRKLDIRRREPLQDHEIPQLTSSDESFSVIYHPLNHSLPREKVTLAKVILLFLMDGKGEIHLAHKTTFLKLFPKFKKQIEDYLSLMDKQQTPIRFNEPEDLRKLLDFCLSQA